MATTPNPTWIGHLGRMVPTPSVAQTEVGPEQRVVFGGGEGTLSPRRARLQGPGARTWKMERDGWYPHELSRVYSLARAQSLYGGSYRVIPPDATDHNMMTPRATEELWDWVGLSVGPVASFPNVDTGEAWPAMLGRVEPGATAWGPVVPVVKRGLLYLAAHIAGVTRMRARGRDASGSITWNAQTTFQQPSAALERVKFNRMPAEGVVSVELGVEAVEAHPVYFAWPSIAYADSPYVTGRGCDKAYLSMPSRTTRSHTIEDATYEIVEVGA